MVESMLSLRKKNPVVPPIFAFFGVGGPCSVQDTIARICVVPTVFAPLPRAPGRTLGRTGRQQRSSMSGPQLVHLEMDEKDKESLQELQQGMAQAQQEQQMLQAKVQMRESERRRCDLTLHELAELPETARAYKQVGKMFLMQPLPELT